MDNSDIYEHRFDELLKIMRRSKDSSSQQADGNDRASAYVIDIAGDEFRSYASSVRTGESWAIYTLEHILMNLLDRAGISYDVPEYREETQSGRVRPVRPFAFRMFVDGRSLGFVFRYRVAKGLLEMRKTFNRFSGIDDIRFYLLNSGSNAADKNIEFLNDVEIKEDASRITFAPIRSFFDEYLSHEEYESFVRHANVFNDSARRLIGLQTMPLPTKEAVEEFKLRVSHSLAENKEHFASMLPDNMFVDQREVFLRNYFDKGLYRALVGESTFADSFVSSEWGYATRIPIDELDQTGVVTGYLKSVEQLLEACLRTFIQAGTVSGYCDDFDTALGTLIRKIKEVRYDRKVCAVNSYAIGYLIDKLYEFKDTERNGHLHDTNIYDEATIDSIRQQAMYLHFLILGAFKIDESAYSELGIPDERVTTDDMSAETLYAKLKKWVEPLVLFDTPVRAGAIGFMLMRFSEGPWQLTYQVLLEIPERDYDEVSWNHRIISSSSTTNNQLCWDADWTWEKTVSVVAKAIRNYVYSDSPAAEKLRTFDKVVLGGLRVIEVIYRSEQH